MEIVISKGERQLLWKLIRKGNIYKERNKIVKLENEVVIFEIVFGMVHGRPYKRFQKNP